MTGCVCVWVHVHACVWMARTGLASAWKLLLWKLESVPKWAGQRDRDTGEGWQMVDGRKRGRVRVTTSGCPLIPARKSVFLKHNNKKNKIKKNSPCRSRLTLVTLEEQIFCFYNKPVFCEVVSECRGGGTRVRGFEDEDPPLSNRMLCLLSLLIDVRLFPVKT